LLCLTISVLLILTDKTPDPNKVPRAGFAMRSDEELLLSTAAMPFRDHVSTSPAPLLGQASTPADLTRRHKGDQAERQPST
jgi:hypothetical protein